MVEIHKFKSAIDFSMLGKDDFIILDDDELYEVINADKWADVNFKIPHTKNFNGKIMLYFTDKITDSDKRLKSTLTKFFSSKSWAPVTESDLYARSNIKKHGREKLSLMLQKMVSLGEVKEIQDTDKRNGSPLMKYESIYK